MTDGSGMSIYLESLGGPPSATVTLASGQIIDAPTGSSGTGGTQTDTNGNKITNTVTSGITSFYETLSTTVLVQKIDPKDPMNVKYTYTSPANTNASVTVSYKTYPIQTNFACSGITEYGPVNSSLVDKITLPDGSIYQFAYEATPTTPMPPGGMVSRQLFWICRRKKVQYVLLLSKRKHAIIPVGNLKVDSP